MKSITPFIIVCFIASFLVSSWHSSVQQKQDVTPVHASIADINTSCHQSTTLSARCMTNQASIIDEAAVQFHTIALFVISTLLSLIWLKPYQSPIYSLFRPPILAGTAR